MVIMETSQGIIEIEMLADKAPVSVKNFLDYVDAGFYDGTIIHRAIPGFMIQGGGFTTEMKEKDTNLPITNEADNGEKNLRTTLSMARTQEKDSATSQFFINVADNAFLDHGSRDFGYAVFARVVTGMDVVDKMVSAPTHNKGFHQDVPVETLTIISARRKAS